MILLFKMLNIKLSQNLEDEYYSINEHFNRISDDWKKYNDEIIPEDKEFAKRITQFLIDVLDYVIINYDNLDVKKYQDFIMDYSSEFYYGPNHDNYNYLDFDETIDNKSLNSITHELRDLDEKITKIKLKKIKTKLTKFLKTFDK